MNAKAPYSAKVISFQPKPAKLGFAQAREVWVQWCCAVLTPAERNFVTSLATYFNASQYKETRELVAWPAWETPHLQMEPIENHHLARATEAGAPGQAQGHPRPVQS